MFCLARTDPDQKPQQGLSFFLIDMKAPGVSTRPIITLDRAHEVNEVALDAVRAPAGWERAAGVTDPGPVGIGDGLDDRRGHLGAGGAVEVGIAIGQGRVHRPHAIDVKGHKPKTLS